MNCESAQNGILLSHTGELSSGLERELQSHLAECASCRQYKTGTERLAALARKTLPTAEPSREVRERILAAGKRAAAKRPVLFFRFTSAGWLSAAAGFLFIAAGSCVFFIAHARRNAEEHGQRVSQLSTIMAMMVAEDDAAVEAAAHGGARTDMRALARQILRVEGLTVDELAADEEISLDEDAPPRDLQSHSTFDSLPEECA